MNHLKYIIILHLYLFANLSFGNDFKNHLPDMGIEIGGGQNTMNWTESSNILCPGGSKVKRKNLFLTPDIRITYRSSLYHSVYLRIFMGYTKFGGKGEDHYIFKTYEYGISPQYKYSNFSFGIGYKLNQIIEARYKIPILNEKRNNWFEDYSHNIGFRASYLLKKISIGGELWFGRNNLSLVGGKVYENQYRIMIGYYFIP